MIRTDVKRTVDGITSSTGNGPLGRPLAYLGILSSRCGPRRPGNVVSKDMGREPLGPCGRLLAQGLGSDTSDWGRGRWGTQRGHRGAWSAGTAPRRLPAAAAAPQTLWGFFGLSSANIHACIAKLCNTQLGQMANNLITGPVGSISGGFIPPLCPPAPTPAQIAALREQAPGGAAATAAKIKASEADAKARVAAVEYLGTVDCSRWKEATKALINALRADPNECVRYAAARVLNSGCCCNKDTIEALRICVAGEDKDGNPPETSPRVKAAAFGALQNCLVRVPEVLPEEVKPKPIERERGSVPNLEPLPGQKPLGRERSTMNDGKDTHLATSLSVPATAVPRFEEQSQPKTFGSDGQRGPTDAGRCLANNQAACHLATG